MSRYYDPVTHRFINADGYFQSGGSILDANTFAYCGNNLINNSDSTGEGWFKDAIKWVQKT
jgi:RHS repeat-associated protein